MDPQVASAASVQRMIQDMKIETSPLTGRKRARCAMRNLFGALLVLLSTQANAQLAQIVVEVYDPSVLNPNWETNFSTPQGLTTYRIYAEMLNPNDAVIEMTSSPVVVSPGVIENCLETFFNTTTSWYNETTVGGNLGSSINPLFFPIIPAVCGDSWLTIGAANSGPGVNVFTVGLPLAPSFNTNPGVNFFGTDGSVFSTPGSPNTLPVGPNNRVLLAQLTTDGDISYGINVSVQPGGVPGTPFTIYTHGDCTVPQNEAQGVTYISDPTGGLLGPPVLATTNVPNDNLCGGESIAEVCVDITLGSPPFEINLVSNANGQVVQTLSAPTTGEYCFTGVGCVNNNGNYTIEVVSDNGFSFEEQVEVTCPEDLEISVDSSPVTCAGQANGSLDLSVTGGTGLVTVETDIPDFVTIEEQTPFDTTINNIPAGSFTITLTDENGCTISEEVVFIEPESLVVEASANDMQCAGQCNGEVVWSAQGGTQPYSLEVFDADGNEQDPDALCAGEYTAVISDANGCNVSVDVVVNEPPAIEFVTASTNVTCNGLDNGTICISDVLGGTGVVQWQIAAPVSQSTPYGNLECFENLPANTYTINFQDEAGCVVTQSNIVITEPGPLNITLDAEDISCFGAGDGSVAVGFTGGTGAVSLVTPQAATLPFTVENLEAGIYLFEIIDETGCTASAEAAILEPELLTLSIDTVFDISCGGTCNGAVGLTIEGGTGDVEILLNGVPSGTNNLCAGIYEITIIDENGCEVTDFFEVVQPDPIEFLINVNNVTCTGMNDGSVSVLPTGGVGDIEWEIVEDVDPTSLFEGTYTITGEDATGCTADTTFTVLADIITDMELTVFSSPVTCWDEQDGTATVAVTGGTPPILYDWNDENAQTTATAIGLEEGGYSVIVTDAIGCTLSAIVEVEPTVGCFFIATVLTPNGDGFNDDWVIGGLEYFPTAMVQVYNRWGQLLFESRGYNQRWDGTWNGRLVSVADYYYVITYDVNSDPLTGTVTVKY